MVFWLLYTLGVLITAYHIDKYYAMPRYWRYIFSTFWPIWWAAVFLNGAF